MILRRSADPALAAARKIEALAESGESAMRLAPIHGFAESWAETEKALKMAAESLRNRNVAIAEEILFLNATAGKSVASDLDMNRIAPLLANPETAGQVINFFSVSRLLESVSDSAAEVAKEILFLSGELSQADRWRRPEMAM